MSPSTKRILRRQRVIHRKRSLEKRLPKISDRFIELFAQELNESLQFASASVKDFGDAINPQP